jgi:uncharacterized protein (DUF58 family)
VTPPAASGALAEAPPGTASRPSPAPGRERSAPRGFRIHSTRDGLFFVLAMTVVIVAAINSGTNLVYLVAALMGGIYIVSFFLSVFSLKGLSLSVHLDREAAEDEEFTWNVTVHNAGPWQRQFVEVRPRFTRTAVETGGEPRGVPTVTEFLKMALRLWDQILHGEPRAGDPGRLLYLGHGQSTAVTLRTRLPGRGEYRLKQVDLHVTFPLRMLQASWTYWPQGRVIVVPTLLRPFYSAATAAEIEVQTESMVDSHRGEGLDYHGLREYLPGDPPKRIHWKVSARTQRLMVREHQQNRSARYYLFLDLDVRKKRGEGSDSNLEHCVRLAATLCRELVTANCHSQVLLLADEFAPSPSIFTASELSVLMRYLGSVPYTRRGSLGGMLARNMSLLTPDSYVVFVAPGATDEECGAMAGLIGRGHRVSMLLPVTGRDAARDLRASRSVTRLAQSGCNVLLHCTATGSLV